MALTREERKLLHQKSKQPTFGFGKPDKGSGNEGDVAYRKIEGSGTVQYLKQDGDWLALSSSKDKPQTRSQTTTRTIISTSGSVSNHNLLSGLLDDDHTQYTHNTVARTISANHNFTGTPIFSSIDINGGAIDGTNITVGSSKTLDVSGGTLTLSDNQISGDKVESGTINAITITGLTTASITATDNIDIGSHDLRASTLTADGLTETRVVFAGANGVLSDDSDLTFSGDTLTATKIAAYTLTGKLTAGSSEIEGSAFDINGGNIDNTPIGSETPSTGAFTTIVASTSVDITGSAGLILENDETITNSTDGTVLINGIVASGSGSGAGVFTSNGDQDVILQTGNSTTGSITITDGVDGNIGIIPNGSGEVDISKVDIASGEIDNTVIGANVQAAGDFTAIGSVSPGTIIGTTIDATVDFTTGTLVITDDQIQMTPSTSDTITIAGASNGVLNITTVDNAAAAANINITADGNISMNSANSITLDTAGTDNEVVISNGGTERFAFQNDGSPEMDVTGNFTIDGSGDITIDSVGETIINTNGSVVARASTSGSLFLHGATDAPANYYACGIQMKKNIYHFSTGHEDFKENYTMLNMYQEPSNFEAYPVI